MPTRPKRGASEVDWQRQYYASTASQYDEMHIGGVSEHEIALGVLTELIGQLSLSSILDIGSGTGRVLLALRSRCAGLQVVGVEPVESLREVGYRKGLERHELVNGDGCSLGFDDGSFDVVSAFGVLHHVPHPSIVIGEMLRVARLGIFVSDGNCFGQGPWFVRTVKQALRTLGLWPAAVFTKTIGRGYHISDGDGLSYPYSVFNNIGQIRRECAAVHFFGTVPSGPNLYRTAGHVAVFGIKSQVQ